MNIGDLVRMPRFNEEDAIFLVLRRDEQMYWKKYDDSSKWAQWHIMQVSTSKIYVQSGRDMEVISVANR
jgi:hypothetical protein